MLFCENTTIYSLGWGTLEITNAPEEFQRHVNEIIEGLEGVTAIVDDLWVTGAGNTHEEALADHERNLIALLQRCRERNFKLNKDKFVFKQQKLKYCGHILASEGILPDPTQVEAITQMPSVMYTADLL